MSELESRYDSIKRGSEVSARQRDRDALVRRIATLEQQCAEQQAAIDALTERIDMIDPTTDEATPEPVSRKRSTKK